MVLSLGVTSVKLSLTKFLCFKNEHCVYYILLKQTTMWYIFCKLKNSTFTSSILWIRSVVYCYVWCEKKKSLLLKMFWNFSLEFLVFILNARASTSEHFHTKEFRLNVKRNAFSRVGVKIWNGIPQIIIIKKKAKKSFSKIIKINATSLISFKLKTPILT